MICFLFLWASSYPLLLNMSQGFNFTRVFSFLSESSMSTLIDPSHQYPLFREILLYINPLTMQIIGSYITLHPLFKPIMTVSAPSAEQSPIDSTFPFIYWIPEIPHVLGFLLISLSPPLKFLLSGMTLSSKCAGTEEAMLDSPCSMKYLYSCASSQSKHLLTHC